MYRPSENEVVIVLARDAVTGDGYRWTSGRATDETKGEKYELLTSSILVEGERGFFHKEDIMEATDENSDEYLGERYE